MILHTVNKSPFDHRAFDSCLRVATADDAILLLEDGVYAALSVAKTHNLYALREDLEARGLSDKVPSQIRCIDYPDFVELSAQATSVQSWY